MTKQRSVSHLGVCVLALACFAPSRQTVRAAEPQPEHNLVVDDYGDPLPFGVVRRFGTVRLRHGDSVTSVLFSPDGTALVSTGGDRSVRFWDPATGRPLEQVWFGNVVDAAAFSPDGSVLCLALPGYVHCWDLKARKQRWVSEWLGGVFPDTVVFLRDGKTVACGSRHSPLVHLFDVESGQLRSKFDSGATTPGGYLAVAPDDDRIAVGGPQRDTIDLCDLDGRVVRRWPAPHDDHGFGCGSLTAAALTPDFRHVITVKGDLTLRVRSADDDRVELTVTDGVRPGPNQPDRAVLAVSHDGKRIAVGLDQHGVFVRAADTGHVVLRRPDVPCDCLAFSPDGKTLAVGTRNQVRLWTLPEGREIAGPNEHRGSVCGLAVLPDGSAVATGGGEGMLRLRALDTGLDVWPPQHLGAKIANIDVAPDGSRLAVAVDNKVQVRDVRRGALEREWKTVTFGRSRARDRE